MKNKIRKKVTSLAPIKKQEPELTPASRITNENLAEHREEVLGKARKFIYPLRHSKHKLVVISLSLFLTALVLFMTYCVVALYKFKSSSDFLYQVSRVIPFPLARIGSDFVSYESYLFEIKHYTHYYGTQQSVDFGSDSGKQQLAEFKKRAYQKVINDAYVKEIAAEKGISVTDQEVEDEITIYRNQNRLGSNNEEFEAVLKDYWDWSLDDFKRTLKQQILNQKVIAVLDTSANEKANKALEEIKSGKDFGTLAKEVSEDPATSSSGGDFGFQIDKNNRDISPKTVEALFKLKPGETSGVVNIGYALEIVKNIEQKEDKIKAAHIIFNFKDVSDYLGEIKDQRKARSYVTFN
ncbi:peptidylprolyl isomerase [Candidatus Saccharibacteria bacterium]|nr:peptidylprolyl isomerase [Candidatus Saccharibacteria bacterium]